MQLFKISFLVFIISLIFFSCTTIKSIYRPSTIPANYYYDENNFVVFKLLNNNINFLHKYEDWKKSNHNKLFLKDYVKIFNLSDSTKKKDKKDKDVFAISKKPIIKSKAKPKIPLEATKQGETKIIWITILIDKTGLVAGAELLDIQDATKQAEIIASSKQSDSQPWVEKKLTIADKQMIYESLIAAAKMEFTPAEQKNKKVIVLMRVPYTFRF